MPKFKVVVGGTFRDVWTVEAESANAAASAYLESGREVKDEGFITITDIWASELQSAMAPIPGPKKSDPKKPRRKRRTKAEIAAAGATEADGVQRGRSVE